MANSSTDPINFEVSAGDWGISDPEEAYRGGNSCDKAGFYHVVAGKVVEEDADNDEKLRNISISLDILAGQNEDQVDRRIYHRLYLAKWIDSKDHALGQEALSAGGLKNLVRFALAFGIIDADTLKSDGGIPFHQLEGQQAIVEVKKEDDRQVKQSDGTIKTYKGQFRIPFSNAWPVNHESQEGVPKDAASMAIASIEQHGTGFEDEGEVGGGPNLDDI